MKRQCGGCTLCCTLLPVKEGIAIDGVPQPGAFHKPANTKCQYEARGIGCTVYGSKHMPMSCKTWTCRWVTNADTDDLPRPDKAGYVIDVMPDFIEFERDGERTPFEVIQVWVDPARPDAHKCEKLRAYLDRRGREGKIALIRFDHKDAFVLVPPSLTGGDWQEMRSNLKSEPQHSHQAIRGAIGHG